MGKKRKYILLLLYIVLACLSASTCQAGNLSLIEKRLQELDALNKQIVAKATGIPQNGTVQTTVTIPPGNSVERVTVQHLSITHFEPHSPFTIQVSSSPQQDRILDVALKLRQAGLPAFVSTSFQHKGKSWWRIFIGSYATKSAAEKANEKLQENRFPKGFVTKMTYAIQLGQEMSVADAVFLEKELQVQQYLPYTTQGGKKGHARVLVGAFKTEAEAALAMKGLRNITAAASLVLR